MSRAWWHLWRRHRSQPATRVHQRDGLDFEGVIMYRTRSSLHLAQPTMYETDGTPHALTGRVEVFRRDVMFMEHAR